MAGSAGRALRARFLMLWALGCASGHERPDAAGEGGVAAAGGRANAGGCSVSEHVEVPLDLFGASVDPPRVLRWGERFLLLGSGSITQTRAADMAVASWQGLDREVHLALGGLCPDDRCMNIFGRAVLADADGNPALLIVDSSATGSMPSYPLRARAWDSASEEAVVAPLFDAHVTAITTRTAMEASRNALRALFVLGNIDDAELELVEVGPDAAAVAPPSTLTVSATYWDCLGIVPTREAGAVSAVAKTEDGMEVVWHLRELDAQANTLLDASLPIPVGAALGYADCPTVVEGPEGFYAQWVSSDQSSLVAVARRTSGPGAEPVLARFDATPGALAGVLGDELVFLALVDGEHPGFVRKSTAGGAETPPLELPPLPESTLEHRRAPPTLLSVEGRSLYVSYELERARVLEAASCP